MKNFLFAAAGTILASMLTSGSAVAEQTAWLGPKPPGAAYPEGEEDRQFAILSYDLSQRSRFKQFAPETFRRESLILEGDRDPLDVILRRTEALLADIRRMSKDPELADMAAELADRRAAAGGTPVEQKEARRALFDKVCHLRRRIAFSNPLLDFDEVLILKRHLAVYNHMCDQYYGMAQRPGGGLFILSDPFGPNPGIRDLLADSVVANGRLKGQKLSGGPERGWKISFDGMGNQRGEETQGGSFLSPDLSFNAKSIAFAYVECRGDRTYRHHTDPSRGHWTEQRCYHIFTVGIDGSNLRMLTDGTFNDFDPCFMPSGRIAFISERRGGYLRCGRVCPTYTLFDMAADGSDIRCLSYHETNEWHPSVTHDGMIVWTRWDYIDRHGCVAHMPWLTTPDGRDPRVVHGNFAVRARRPDMEVDIRAIPRSHRFIATAAPHHNQSFGSLIVFDACSEDNDGLGPVKRVTPDAGFPESQRGSLTYGQAWPLSEDYYLCAYEPAEVKALKPGRTYGVYLVDSFGNKELIYRDRAIACQSPIPLRQRPKPPAPPVFVRQDGPPPNPSVPGSDGGQSAEATLAVINVYDGLKPWPEGTQIKALRVLQVLPMSVPSGRPPHEIGLRLPTAGDSVNPVRYVLGTVPVEEDGSAHFAVPAHKEIFFQALDERGLAIQSMRSATYLQAGERLVCQGCHERRHHAPMRTVIVPKALQRAPSRLKPDVDGSYPFSYPRLVQPVLDRLCVKCHAEHPKKPISLAREPIQRRWYTSYLSLAPKYGFYRYGSGHRTTPGQFGARHSKLFEILEKGHYDVKLSEEDLHRITLWLDCCSLFYGVYEKEGGEAQLRGEIVKPTLQ